MRNILNSASHCTFSGPLHVSTTVLILLYSEDHRLDPMEPKIRAVKLPHASHFKVTGNNGVAMSFFGRLPIEWQYACSITSIKMSGYRSRRLVTPIDLQDLDKSNLACKLGGQSEIASLMSSMPNIIPRKLWQCGKYLHVPS